MAQSLSNLPIGAKIKYGSLYGNALPWIIVDRYHSGYPSNSITIATEKQITIRSFDAKEPTNTNSNRKRYGNNRYRYSNLRQWLNSSASAGNWYSAQHSMDAPPNSANVWEKHNPYDTQAGFLYNFTSAERNAAMSTTLTVTLGSADGGGSESVTDKIWLASRTEVGLGNENGVAEGSAIGYFTSTTRKSKPSTDAAKNCDYTPSGFNVNSNWTWWLRTPYYSNAGWMRLIGTSGALYDNSTTGEPGASGGNRGVRVFCNLSASLKVSDNVDSDGCYTIIFNNAPSTPSSIYLPSTIKSGSYFTVSWSSSSDSDGNLQGYYVYRSLDGGSWSQIYQGGSTSTSDYISYGSANSVQYRVYAYDTQGASSSYCYSSTKTIVHNLAPSTPSSITVPTFVKGGTSLTVTWGAASDSDGNLSGYQLDRQYNGGSWSQIYSGSGRSYTDTITKGWTSVAYRVRAYDSYSSYSSYTTSPTRTVNNNTAPAITCDLSGDLGDKDAAFSFDYSVADVDGDAVTVTEAIDGATKRTYAATLDASNTFTISDGDFMCLLNGPHTIKVTATDANAGTSDLTLTFTKTVYACRITLAEPKPVGDAITKTVLMITRSIPADAEFTVMVTNNANDPEPVWEDVTANVKTSLNYIYENKTAENGPAYNFVITASRAEGGQGGYISSIGGAFE